MIISSLAVPISTLGIIGKLYSCPKLPQPRIHIYATENRLLIDNTKNRQQLNSLSKTSLSPIYGREFPVVNGLTSSKIDISADTSFAIASNPILKKSCITAQEVSVNLVYSPTVYIYRNYRPNSCIYNEVMKHELQHVQVDRNALSAFKEYIKKATEYAIETTKEAKPFNSTLLESKKIHISKSISTAVKFATNKMQEQLTSRQRQIDTREEYQRLSEVCPHENKR